MKTILFFLLILTASISAKEPQWKKFDEGLKLSKLSGKKVLVDVYTDWCSWCKKMDANTYSDKTVSEYLEKNFVIIKLNAEGAGTISYDGKKISPAEFAQGMGVTGYPATLFMRSDGQPITLLPGYSEAGMFIHVLSFISENRYEKQKFADYLTEKGVKQ
ncbi:MAG: thioredoxin family protein [Bacteroidota bacterium]